MPEYMISASSGLWHYDYAEDFVTNIPRGTKGYTDVTDAFGISWTSERMYVAWRHPDEIVEYDLNFKPTGRSISNEGKPWGMLLGDIHQILCHDGRIWVTCCGYNCIQVYDAISFNLERVWNPCDGHDSDELGEESNNGKYKHWNSIRIMGDRLYLVSHMYDCPPSKVWEFSFPDLKFIRKIPGGECVHNVFFHDGALAVLSSKDGRILFPESGKSITFFDRKPFWRGISQAGGRLALGFSSQCLSRAARPDVPGGVVFLDHSDPMRFDVKCNGIGPIMEIRCLDEHDAAHDAAPFKPRFKEETRLKIGMLVIATGKYIRFVAPLWESAKKHFMKGHELTMFVFTDADAVPDGCVKIPHAHEAWPGPTLHRYHTFLKAKDQLLTQDYLYYSDADMLFVDDVGAEAIGDLVATIHPGFYNKPKTEFSYERRPESLCYVPPGHGSHYFAGGFNGGGAKRFLEMATEVSSWITQDEARGIIPVWHDESAANRFWIGNPPTVRLSPSYCYPEAWSIPFQRRLLALDKNHAEMRS